LKEERKALLDDNDSLNIRLHESFVENEEIRKKIQVLDFLSG